jgi:DNA primase
MDLSRFAADAQNSVDVDAIKAQPLSELVSRYGVQLRKQGREYLGLCPFHAEKTPSFTVDDGKGLFYCHGCHAGGDHFSFVQKADGVDFEEAAARLDDGSASPIKPDPEAERIRRLREAAEEAERERNRQHARAIWRSSIPLWDPKAEIACRYLAGRGLPEPYPETLSFARIDHPDGPEEMPCLIVAKHSPHDGDHVRGIQRIFLTDTGKKYPVPKRAKFSLGSVKDGRSRLINTFPLERLILAEGPETALSAYHIFGGHDWACWAYCAGFPKDTPLPNTVKEILIVADADESGVSETKALALAEWVRAKGITVDVMVPDQVGLDANDLLRSEGQS